MTPIFGKGKFFLKIGRVVCLHTQRNCSCTVILHGYQAFLCFAFLKKNSKSQNGHHFWRVRYSLKLGKASLHLWVKNFAEIAPSRTVFEIQAFLCFVIFAKNLEIQNGCHFWREIFFQNWVIYSENFPVGQKYC